MKLGGENVPLKIIRLIDPRVDEHQVLRSLLPLLGAPYQARPMILHFDVTTSVSAPAAAARWPGRKRRSSHGLSRLPPAEGASGSRVDPQPHRSQDRDEKVLGAGDLVF